jgi:hypothetical protein
MSEIEVLDFCARLRIAMLYAVNHGLRVEAHFENGLYTDAGKIRAGVFIHYQKDKDAVPTTNYKPLTDAERKELHKPLTEEYVAHFGEGQIARDARRQLAREIAIKCKEGIPLDSEPTCSGNMKDVTFRIFKTRDDEPPPEPEIVERKP